VELPHSPELERFLRERKNRSILGAVKEVLKAKAREDDLRHWYHEVWLRCARHGCTQMSHGTERIAFIDPRANLIVKTRFNTHVSQAFEVERRVHEAFLTRHPELAEHLPRTWWVHEDVVIQERVRPDAEKYAALFDKETRKQWQQRLGVRDLSRSNVGWRGDTPVFIDVALRPGQEIAEAWHLDSESHTSQSDPCAPRDVSFGS